MGERQRQRKLTWGLGIEHEQLLGFPPSKEDERQGLTPHLPSHKIVRSVLMDDLVSVYKVVSAAIGSQVYMKRLQQRIKENRNNDADDEDDEAAEAIRLTPDRVRACRPAFGGVSDPKLIRRIPRDVLIRFLATEFPHMTQHPYYFLGVNAELFGGTTWDYDWETTSGPTKDLIAMVFKLQRNWKKRVYAFAESLMLNNNTTEPALIDAFDKCIASNPAASGTTRYGDAFMRSYYGRLSRMKGFQNSKKEPIPTDMLVRIAADSQRRFFNLGKSSDGRTIELDGSFVEVKTSKFKDVKIESLVAELHSHESRALKAARKLHPKAFPLPHSGYARLVEVDPKRQISRGRGAGKAEYAGSYHFWFTLPHTAPLALGPEFQAFVTDHRNFANVLQWMEPLLLSCTGMDPRAIGAGTRYPRANMRGTLNFLSGIGIVNSCDLNLRDLYKRPFVYFPSETAFRAFVATGGGSGGSSGADKKMHDASINPVVLWTTIDGRTYFPYWMCKETGRTEDDGYDLEHAMLDGANSDQLLDIGTSRTMHNRLLKSRSAEFSMHTGNDVRAAWCDEFGLPLKKGFVPTVVFVESKKRFELRFYTPKSKEVSVKMPVKDGFRGVSPMGFEFRLMDNMPSATCALQLLRVFALCACASKRARVSCVTPNTHSGWNDAVASVLLQGRHAVLSDRYVHALAKRLDIPPIITNTDTNKKDTRSVLDAVCAGLHKAYRGHPWMRLLSRGGGGGDDVPVIPDNNTASWNDAMKLYLQSESADDERKKQLDTVWKLDEDKDDEATWNEAALGILGEPWRHDIPFLRAYIAAQAHPPFNLKSLRGAV